eukprot:Unigene944_Nuclearia_a/m.3018 Unigene944_Nuclearia_a/g.3018  ORF Unigene944_Nuclearia_a/g.3018 Unigene944_Nuclearia_a/m.3018 type:complete len:311 (-) Unigene944_Nuclearia_a:590-1522(-)
MSPHWPQIEYGGESFTLSWQTAHSAVSSRSKICCAMSAACSCASVSVTLGLHRSSWSRLLNSCSAAGTLGTHAVRCGSATSRTKYCSSPSDRREKNALSCSSEPHTNAGRSTPLATSMRAHTSCSSDSDGFTVGAVGRVGEAEPAGVDDARDVVAGRNRSLLPSRDGSWHSISTFPSIVHTSGVVLDSAAPSGGASCARVSGSGAREAAATTGELAALTKRGGLGVASAVRGDDAAGRLAAEGGLLDRRSSTPCTAAGAPRPDDDPRCLCTCLLAPPCSLSRYQHEPQTLWCTPFTIVLLCRLWPRTLWQ